MADKRISELIALAGASVADDDALAIVDTSATQTKKIVFSELKAALDTSTGFVRITGDTMTGDLSFGDNGKAIFGAGSDLQIYHDGSNSYIYEVGTGDLVIQTNGAKVGLAKASPFEWMLEANVDGAVTLYHDNAAKLATTSTGIDVTGTVTATTALEVSSGVPYIDWTDTATTDEDTRAITFNGDFYIGTIDDAKTTTKKRFLIDHSTGDISFYEDTGSTPKLTWDASAESLNFADNVKATFGDGDLQIYHDGSNSYVRDNGTGTLTLQGSSQVKIQSPVTGENYAIFNDNGAVTLNYDNSLKFATNATGIDVTGTVTADGLTVDKGSAGTLATFTDGVNSNFVVETASLITTVGNTGGSTALAFKSANTEALRIDASQNVQLGSESSVTGGRYFDIYNTASGATDFSILRFITQQVGSSSTVSADIYKRKNGQFTISNNETHADAFTSFNVGASERLRLTSAGSVGIGTSSPAYTIDAASSGNTQIHLKASGQSDGLEIGQLSADGGSAITATNNNYLKFGTNNTEAMRLTFDGSLRLGTTSNEGITNQFTVKYGGGGAEYGMVMRPAADTTVPIYFQNASGGNVGSISITASSTSYNTSSDYRLKENVTDVTDGITRVKQLAPKRFNFIADPDTTVDGFLAHEAQAVVPEAVTGTHNEVDDDGNAKMQGIDQAKLVPLLTAALQEAIAKIETLETKVAALEGA